VAESTARRDAASEPVVNLAVTLAESGGKPDDYADLLDELRSLLRCPEWRQIRSHRERTEDCPGRPQPPWGFEVLRQLLERPRSL
jgi:hypothetical protein